MMWAPLLLAGFLSGWWGALAFAAAPPANRDFLEGTLTSSATRIFVASVTDATETRDQAPPPPPPPHSSMILRNDGRPPSSPDPVIFRYHVDGPSRSRGTTTSVDTASILRVDGKNGNSWSYLNPGGALAPFEDSAKYRVTPTSLGLRDAGTSASLDEQEEDEEAEEEESEEDDAIGRKRINDEGRKRNKESQEVPRYPKMEEFGLAHPPRHSSTQLASLYRGEVAESSMESPRVRRSAKQRPKNRTRAESPREQRRRCKNKGGCRGQNWCPDVDVGNRAYLAPTVFEGKARSMSLRKPGLNYAVTFEVKQVYKSQSGFQPLQKNDSVRLHFRDKSAPGKSTVCGYDGNPTGSKQQQQQQQRDQSGVVRANIKRGKVYLVFVNRVGPRNFTILGEPVIRSKKNEQAVQAVVRPDYVREVTLSELRDSIARLRDRVKLVCRTRGSPPPRVHWLKDGVLLHPRRGLRIQHKRRRSKVVISSAKPEDSGRYECVAESTSGHRASLAAQLLVDDDTRISETTTAAWPRQEQPCPIAGDFCMNGGTCLFFETVGEPACRCAEGFTGLRCETKDVISTGNMDKFSSFAEDVTLARF